MNIFIIIKIIYLSYDKEEIKRLLFSALGISLGVILFIAIRISTDNIKLSVSASQNYLGNSVVEIVSDNGIIPESDLEKIALMPEVKILMPISKKTIQINNDRGSMGFANISGLDVIKLLDFNHNADHAHGYILASYLKYLSPDPVYVSVSQKLFDQVQNTPKELMLDINGARKKVLVADVIPKAMDPIGLDENKVIMDLANFQKIFNEYGSVNQITLVLFEPDNPTAISSIKSQLPANLKILNNSQKNSYVTDITSTFRFNLNFLIVLTLLVTGVMTYNSISYYILERRHEFGLLMMLGARPASLVTAVLIASTVIAIFCTIGGIFIGYWLSKVFISLITKSISNIYFPISITQVYIDSSIIITIFCITIAMTLIASILPCSEIYNIPLRETISYQTYEQNFQKQIKKITMIGFLLLVVSLICISPQILAYNRQIAFAALIGIMLSIAFFQPYMLDLFLRLSEFTVGKHFFSANLAAEHIRTTMRKNVVAIAAISMAIALCAISFIIIDSTKKNIFDWVDYVNSADIYVKGSTSDSIDEYLPNKVVNTVKILPGLADYDASVFKDIVYNNLPIRIEGKNFNVLGNQSIIKFTKPLTKFQIDEIATNPSNVFISDRAAKQFKLKVGDIISIPANTSNYPITIAAIYYNYSSDRNFILMNIDTFSKIYAQPNIQEISLYLKDHTQRSKILAELQNKFADQDIIIINNDEMRRITDDIVKQAFSVGDIILLITLAAAIITLFTTVGELILSRTNEFTIFWALGATDLQIFKMCFWESLLICVSAILTAIIPIAVMIYIIFFYLNQIFFGTDIFLYIPYKIGFIFILFLLFIGFLAGFLPALKMKKSMTAERLKYE